MCPAGKVPSDYATPTCQNACPVDWTDIGTGCMRFPAAPTLLDSGTTGVPPTLTLASATCPTGAVSDPSTCPNGGMASEGVQGLCVWCCPDGTTALAPPDDGVCEKTDTAVAGTFVEAEPAGGQLPFSGDPEFGNNMEAFLAHIWKTTYYVLGAYGALCLLAYAWGYALSKAETDDGKVRHG